MKLQIDIYQMMYFTHHCIITNIYFRSISFWYQGSRCTLGRLSFLWKSYIPFIAFFCSRHQRLQDDATMLEDHDLLWNIIFLFFLRFFIHLSFILRQGNAYFAICAALHALPSESTVKSLLALNNKVTLGGWIQLLKSLMVVNAHSVRRTNA